VSANRLQAWYLDSFSKPLDKLSLVEFCWALWQMVDFCLIPYLQLAGQGHAPDQMAMLSNKNISPVALGWFLPVIPHSYGLVFDTVLIIDTCTQLVLNSPENTKHGTANGLNRGCWETLKKLVLNGSFWNAQLIQCRPLACFFFFFPAKRGEQVFWPDLDPLLIAVVHQRCDEPEWLFFQK